MIIPSWPVNSKIKSYSTTRAGGVSLAPYDSLNLGEHVEDNSEHVQQNRKILKAQLQLPNDPTWLKQTHSSEVITLNSTPEKPPYADASYSREKNIVCTVLTADCLPLLLCSRLGDEIAAVHCGWRGLAAGIIKNTVKHFSAKPEDIFAWMGPAIGPNAFQVRDDVYDTFIKLDSKHAQAFQHDTTGKWLCSLYCLAKQVLLNCNINNIYGGEFCTFSDSSRFFSYRRDNGVTGRMASLIWIST